MANLDTAIFAGGCFWCLEAVFQRVRGVTVVESGYTGGRVDRPTYEQVCSGTTGHAEAVRVTFNPELVSYRELLDVFFAVHDPTTLNQQGNDVGTQYRSAIFYNSDQQRREAEQLIKELNAAHTWERPIVTTVEPASAFFVAERYHQDYYNNNSRQPYCQYVIVPKLRKFEQHFAEKRKA